MLLENLNLKQKLNGSFAVVFLSLLIIGFFIYQGISEIRDINALIEKENEVLSYVHQTRQNNLSLRFRASRMYSSTRIKRAEKFRKNYEDDAQEIFSDLAILDSAYASLIKDESEEINHLILVSKDSIIVYLKEQMLPSLQASIPPLHRWIDKVNALDIHLKQDSINSETILMLNQEIDVLRTEVLGHADVLYSRYAEINRLAKGMRDQLQDTISAHQKEIYEVINKTLIFILVAIGFALMLIAGVSSFLNRIIVPPVRKVASFLTEFANGKFPDIALRESNDEVGLMGKEINKLKTNLERSTDFANAMGKGNFEMVFEAKDALGQSLLGMRDSLKTSYEQERARKFLSEGLAQINSELRKQKDNVEAFGDNLLYCIIKYLNLQVGAFYVVHKNEGVVTLEMEACYAYDRKKFINTSIKPGEGVVGQAYEERSPIFLSEVPDSYIKIRSGLGDTPPRSIFCTPLIHNDDVVGVLEFASIKPISELGRQFIEESAEAIASDLSAQKINNETKQLLDESQKRRQQMESQEEELRQNMEELQATQETISQNENRVKAILASIQDGIITFDKTGIIGSVNPATGRIFGYTSQELIGASSKLLFAKRYDEILEYIESEDPDLPVKTIMVQGKRKDGHIFDARIRLDDTVVGSERMVIGVIKLQD